MPKSPSTAPPQAGAETFSSLQLRGISSLRDTFCSHHHSRDFSFARGAYMRSRVLVVGSIFLLLTPLWTLLDTVMLPPDIQPATFTARLVMVLALLLTLWLARTSLGSYQRARLAAGLLLGIPAMFYAVVLHSLGVGTAHSLIGYSFIPYMLTVMLSIFPLTLLESGIAGLALLALQAGSQWVSGSWLTPQGFQESWLLAALLFITLSANYFSLGLLLRLYREATHDSLTGLLNRGALHQSVTQLRTRRPPPALTLLMMDLDYFKRINDTYGHSVGDQVLRQFADILRQQLDKNDFKARYGGEEFVAVLNNRSKAQAMEIAEGIRQQAERTMVTDHEGNSFNFTVSVGVASFGEDEPLEAVARRADERLYAAKQRARNCVVGD